MSLYFRCQIGVIRDHQRDLGVQLAGFPPPEQIDQTMALLGDQDCHALGTVGETDSPVHPMLTRQRGKRGIKLVPAQAETLALDLHPHEEGAIWWITHVLVGTQNVPIMQGDETRNRRDQTLVIGAVDQKPDVIAHGQINLIDHRMTDAASSEGWHPDRTGPERRDGPGYQARRAGRGARPPREHGHQGRTLRR